MNPCTPGPWTADLNCDGAITSGDHLVARVSANQYTPPRDRRKKVSSLNWSYSAQDQANARLIAAAPDLLDALHDLMDQLEGVGIAIEDQDSGQWHGAEGLSFAKARAAIAKAAQP